LCSDNLSDCLLQNFSLQEKDRRDTHREKKKETKQTTKKTLNKNKKRVKILKPLSLSLSLSLTMEYQTSTTPVAFSGELGPGGRLSRKHVYDGVLSGGTNTRKSGARVEDYREIFAGSGGSSIPFLDVPELNERQLSGETAAVRGSRVDYSKVFGGFGEAEYAVPYEELFAAKPKKSKSFSSKGAGAPDEARRRASVPEHSNFSEKKQMPLPETSFDSLNGAKQVNVLYHKVNPRHENGTNGTTHIAQLHATPGYTCLIDENKPSQRKQNSRPAHPGLNEAHMNVDVSKVVKESKPVRKVVSGPQPSVASEFTSRGPIEFENKSGRNRSFSTDMPFDAFDVGIGGDPSKMQQPTSGLPPYGGNKKGGFGASMNLNGEVCGNDASGNYSPPSFYEEIDANSAAAASAAAVMKAIEEAQMKIRIAKELMGRKKGGFQNSVKPSFSNLWKAREGEVQNAEKANGSKDKEANRMFEKEDTSGSTFTGHVATSERPVTAELQDKLHSSIAKNDAGETRCREATSTPAEVSLEDGEDRQEAGVGETVTNSSKSQLAGAGNSLLEEAEDWHETVAGDTTTPCSDSKLSEADNSLLEEAEDWHETVVGETPTPCSESNSTEVEDWHETVVGEMLSPYNKPQSAEANNSLDEAEDWQETVVGEMPTPYRESRSMEVDSSMEEAEDWEETEEFFEPSGTGENEERSLQSMQEENTKEAMPCGYETEHLENLIVGEDVVEPKDCGVELEVSQEASVQEGGKPNSKWDIHENKTNSVLDLHHEECDEEKTELTDKDNVTIQTPEAPLEKEKSQRRSRKLWKQEGTIELKCERRSRKLWKREGNIELQMQELEENDAMEEAEAQNWVEMEKKQPVALNRKEMENIRDEILAREENASRLGEIHPDRENGKVHQESWDREECEKLEVEDWKQEENDNTPDVPRREETKDNSNEVDEEVKPVSYDGSTVEEECENRSVEDGETKTDGNEELKDAKQDDMMLKAESPMNETEKGQENTCRWAETEKTELDVRPRADEERNPSATREALSHENDFVVVDEDVNQGATVETCWQADIGRVAVNAEVIIDDNGKINKVSKTPFVSEETGKQSTVHEEDNVLEEQQHYQNGELGKDFIKFDGIQNQTEEPAEALLMADSRTSLGETILNLRNEQYDGTGAEYKTVSDQEKLTGKQVLELNEADEDVSECDKRDEDSYASSQGEEWLGNEIEPHNDSKPHIEEVAFEEEQKEHESKESEVAKNHTEDEIPLGFSAVEKRACNGIEGKDMAPEYEEKTDQSTDKKMEDRHVSLKLERETEVTLQRKGEVEKRESRKKEEAKEREMEKEKERLAVERAIREARERAFAEARERAEKAVAERAAAEANQRLKAEAQKASSQTNDKLAADKVLRDAKLRAERAAVERATAEARVRALEKAMSEKAASKGRKDDRINPSVSANLFVVLNLIFYVSILFWWLWEIHDLLNFRINSVKTVLPAAQDIQALQIMEAKALAEKNMRDLLAQKEQAERNRLADTLDAEVKRWSSGKERNLRALLSTLQYILGPDSGWQSIPLTDLIPTAAVKKAYRKATLFVHPDKLQQRGASIQQKYICEKVFDLLKEAWNKFSAEE
ncbi:hypothetical protein Tsubulata_009442, partial [Turnera subulata]